MSFVHERYIIGAVVCKLACTLEAVEPYGDKLMRVYPGSVNLRHQVGVKRAMSAFDGVDYKILA